MTYESLDKKYRPRTFDQLLGQDPLVKTVRGMLKRKSPKRAILIQGPYGSGKTTTARLISSYVNCIGEDREMHEAPCGTCQVCIRMAKGAFDDYSEINAAEKRKIEDIRSLIDAAQYAPQSNFRIFVLDEVHQLTSQAEQAFLKILEEPPPSTMFILCTTDPQRILPTIKSRCLKLKVGYVDPKDTVKVLANIVAGEELDTKLFNDELLAKIATVVSGHPRDAIATLEAVINNVADAGDISDLDALLVEIAEDVVGETPEAVAAKFLLGVYKGKFTAAIMAAKEVANPEAFSNTLMDFHTHTMRWRFSPKLQDKMMYGWYAKLEEAFGPQKEVQVPGLFPDVMVEVMDILLDTSSRLKTYTVDPYYTMFNTAAKATSVCRRAAG